MEEISSRKNQYARLDVAISAVANGAEKPPRSVLKPRFFCTRKRLLKSIRKRSKPR